MTIDQLKEKLVVLRSTLNTKQQKMLSLNSIENFILSYNRLNYNKEQVLKLLVSYFDKIEEYNYVIDKRISNKIAFDYIMKIGTFYSNELGFKVQIELRFALMVGLHIDALLLLTGFLKMVYYIPIITFIIMCRWFYLKIYYEKRNKVHNIRY